MKKYTYIEDVSVSHYYEVELQDDVPPTKMNIRKAVMDTKPFKEKFWEMTGNSLISEDGDELEFAE